MSSGRWREYNSWRAIAWDAKRALQAAPCGRRRWMRSRIEAATPWHTGRSYGSPRSGNRFRKECRKRQRIRQVNASGTRKKGSAGRRSGRRAAAWFYRRHGSGSCHAVGISAHSCRTTKALPRCSALAVAAAVGRLRLRLPSLLASDGPGRRTDGIWYGDRPSGRAGHGCSCR